MIKSVIWASMLDYPCHVCTTIFFDKCNFKCEYCQNKDLEKMKDLDFEKEILPKLIERQAFVDYIVLSGGECTIDSYTQKIINLLYEKGFKIGLHTNGTMPEFLEKNINKLSYIGMDIKNDLDKYEEISGAKVNIDKIKNSIEIIIKNLKDYEFRTTIYPKFINEEDCIQIAKYLQKNKAKKYVLQQYKKIQGLAVIPFSREKLEEIQAKCNEFVPTVLRG